MEQVREKEIMNSFESLLVVDILEELISALQLYSFVLPHEKIQRTPVVDSVPYCHTSIDNETDRISEGFEEMDVSAELVNLRQVIETDSHKKLTVKESVKSDPDNIMLSESMKIHQDLSNLIRVLSTTKSEVQTSRTFNHLREKVKEEEMSFTEELILESHLKSKQEDVKRVQTDLLQSEKESLETEQEEMCQINNLKDQLHLLKQQGEADKAFTKVWLTARNEQDRLGQKDEILAHSSRMKSIRCRMDRDCDSFENVTAWTKLVSAKLEQKIRDWKDKFETDVQSMEQRILKKRKNIEAQQERIRCLETTIGERMVELAPWDEEKAQEKLQRLAHMRRYYSCRKIQRWWRKYMISHALYKRKKPKPKATKPVKKSKK